MGLIERFSSSAPVLELSWLARIAQGGWGLVTSGDTPPEIEQALEPLLSRRRGQVGPRFRICSGPLGYQRGESAQDFLARQRSSLQPAKDDPIPQSLLLVGGPEEIPFRVQTELSAARGVGRIAFDRVDDYARYARTVVRFEEQWSGGGRFSIEDGESQSAFHIEGPRATAKPSMSLLAPARQGDPLAQWADQLVSVSKLSVAKSGWPATVIRERVDKSAIASALTRAAGPLVVFIAAHGVECARGAPQQAAAQGALVSSDWTVPAGHDTRLDPGMMFGAEDVEANADGAGRIVVAAASFSAGTPTADAFALHVLSRVGALSPRPFVAELPKRLLGLERGAVSFIGHTDRVWGVGGPAGRAAAPLAAAYGVFFQGLSQGTPVGLAARVFSLRAAAMAKLLEELSDNLTATGGQGAREVAEAWTAQRDLASVVVLGDPAVRVSLLAQPKSGGTIVLPLSHTLSR